MPDSKTYLPNGLRVGTALEVDTDEMSIGDNAELTIGHDGIKATIKTDNVAGSDLDIETGTGKTNLGDGLIVGTHMEVDTDEMSIGDNAELTIGHDGTDATIKTDNVAPSDLIIETGTGKTAVFSDAYDDLPPNPIIGAKLGATAPTLRTFIGDIEQFTFDASNDYVIGATEITHKYKEGTDLSAHVHWATNGQDIDERTVKWQLSYSIANSVYTVPPERQFGAVFDTQVVISEEIAVPATILDRTHVISTIGTIPGTILKIGAYVVWRFERIASSGTEPTSDPFALAVGFHSAIDTVGSRTIFIK